MAGAVVSIERINGDLKGTTRKLLDDHGLSEIIASRSSEVYIKVNAVDFKPYSFTSPEVVGEVVDYCVEAGAKKVLIMDNSTQGNITRLVFEVCGYNKLAGSKGVEVLYLDEGRRSEVRLPRMGYSVKVSRVVGHMIEERENICYINIPRLKTHSMTVLTGGIKNQYGFIDHHDRSVDHNYMLHRKLADIYSLIKPDFTLVDGTVATIYGHYPPIALHDRTLVPLDILIAGRDTLAVDVVCAKVLGYDADEVPHLREAAQMGLGTYRLNEITVKGEPLSSFKEKYPYRLYDRFPPDVRLVRGAERNCLEGCNANTLALLQVLWLDFGGKGGFTILMGKGFDSDEVQSVEGKVFIAGICAYEELGSYMERRLGRRNVFFTKECNDLAGITAALTKLMGVSPLKMVPLNPLKSFVILMRSRLHGSTARIPPLL